MPSDFEKKLEIWLSYLAYFLLFCFISPFVFFFIAIISRSGGEGTWWLLYVTLSIELGGYMFLAMIWYTSSRFSISIVKYPLYIIVILASFPLLDIKRLGLFTTIDFEPLWMQLHRYYNNPERMMEYIHNLSFSGNPPYYPSFQYIILFLA